MEDEEEEVPHDAIAILAAASGSSEASSPSSSSSERVPSVLLGDPKEETKRVLEKAGPAAAKRLARIAEYGDDKEAVSASQAILDRIGFGKVDSLPHVAKDSVLPLQAMISALIGIGKVVGVKEAENLKNITPGEFENAEEVEEGTLQASVPAQAVALAALPARPVRRQRVRKDRQAGNPSSSGD